MKDKVRSVLKYIAVYMIAAAVMTGLLVGVAMIPQSSIRDNVKKSAEYICSRALFENRVKAMDASRIDRYADAILIGIAYQYDSDKPLESVMWSAYYRDRRQNEDDNLLQAVTEGKEANQQYMRYWHGSNVIVRVLLTFLSVKGIYILNGVLLTILFGILIFLLARSKAYILIAGLIAGFIATAAWFVPYSLEYTWVFYIMLVTSIIMARRESKGKEVGLGIIFMITGMVTCFMDFLTAELLTLLVPLMIVLWYRWRSDEKAPGRLGGRDTDVRAGKHGSRRSENKIFGCNKAAGAVIAWGIGYAGMWLTKWLMASIVLGENMTPYIKANLEERIGGDLGMGFWDYLRGAMDRNVKALIPWGLGTGGFFAALLIILAVCYFCFVYKKDKVRRGCILIYAAIALIPFVRFLVLHNHSYLHYFFTCRALIISIMAVVMIMGEMIDWGALRHENKKKRRT